MILDLAREPARQQRSVDVCVIGSGPAGLTVSRALAEQGLRVALVESGSQSAAPVNHQRDLHFGRSEYRGATLGRAFGFGGTSSLWGGQLLPILPGDMCVRPHVCTPAWPIPFRELERHFARLETWLGVDTSAYGLETAHRLAHPLADCDWSDFAPRFSKWIPFSRRNLAATWWKYVSATGNAQCWLNAALCDWHWQENERRLAVVVARAASGNSLAIEADQFVIAAGAIESTRLLLEVQDQTRRLSAPKSLLGGFLSDHLSIRIAEVEIRDRNGFMDFFAPFFAHGTMRSLRMEVTQSLARELGIPALYAHFVAEAPQQSGFALVRDTLRAAQKGRASEVFKQVPRIAGAIPGIAEIAYWRLLKKRLPFPSGARIYLHLDFEQPPAAGNRIFLGDVAAPGQRKPTHIDWHPGAEPVSLTRVMTRHLRALWKRNGFDRLATLRFVSPDVLRASWPSNLYDIYHPAGTSRMALDAEDGIVDCNLRAFGTDNLYVLSTAVFPSMGAANPTFTLMALGLRLAQHLADNKIRA